MAGAEVQAQRKLSGRRKAAMLLVTLGPEVAAEVMKSLDEKEVAELSSEMSSMGEVSANERRSVIGDFHNLAAERRFSTVGGPGYAREALARCFGDERAAEVLSKWSQDPSFAQAEAEDDSLAAMVSSFKDLDELDPRTIHELVANEHPQTIAVVLAHLRPRKAAEVVSLLPEDRSTQMLMRVAQLGPVPGELVAEIQSTLKEQAQERPEPPHRIDGSRVVARILNASSKEAEEQVLTLLESEDPELAEAIQRQLFLFEDIAKLDDRSIQKILRSVDARTLATALKAATDELKEKVFSNMSKRAGEMLQSEMEASGPARVDEIEAAQAELIKEVRKLEQDGEIVVPRGDEAEGE
jgi:flagellar motor switch protein FliG